MKRFILTLACLLMAGPAFGASRTVTEGLVQGQGDLVTLFNIPAAEVTASGTCLAVVGGVTTVDSVACEDPAINEFQVYRKAKVTELVVTVTSVGDSAWVCVFTIEIDGTATGNTLVTGITESEGDQNRQAQNFVILPGTGLGIMVGNTGGGNQCGDTADPSYSVQVLGYYLATDA